MCSYVNSYFLYPGPSIPSHNKIRQEIHTSNLFSQVLFRADMKMGSPRMAGWGWVRVHPQVLPFVSAAPLVAQAIESHLSLQLMENN